MLPSQPYSTLDQLVLKFLSYKVGGSEKFVGLVLTVQGFRCKPPSLFFFTVDLMETQRFDDELIARIADIMERPASRPRVLGFAGFRVFSV